MSSHYAYISLDVASHDLAFLENQGVVDFVHFTTADNLPGILREGLLPRKELDSRGIAYTNTDELRLEGKSVVNLSITNPNIKMFYGKRKDLSERLFVVLTLDPALLKDVEGAYEFRSTNAASRFSQPCSIEEVFAGDRPSFFEPNWPTDNQAEVLVRGGISPAHIKTIQFPYSDMGNPEAIAAAASTADLAKELGLSCDILFCNKHFDYNKSFLGELDPKGRYEYYFVSWAEDEQAAAASEEAIRLIERQKTFDSVALMADRLESIEVHPNKEVEPLFTWSMRYHAPAETSERSNAQLSAFAVIEKIVNRGRITRLSYELEQKLSSDDETACAHQAQCAIVELVKHMPEIISALVKGLAEGIGDFFQMGANLVRGLWEGIKSLAGWIWEKVSNWAQDLWNGILNFFGIHSPSRKFAYAGSMMMKGLGEGIGPRRPAHRLAGGFLLRRGQFGGIGGKRHGRIKNRQLQQLLVGRHRVADGAGARRGERLPA